MKSPNPNKANRLDVDELPSLRGATIRCLWCDQPRPMAGATKFRAHWVCAGCTVKLQTTKETAK